MNSKTYQNVYASYTITPRSVELLQKFSRDMLHILQKYPYDDKPIIETPSNYHFTADYRGIVGNIDTYIDEISQRKKNHKGYIECDGIGVRKSKLNQNDIIFIKPLEPLPFTPAYTDYDSIPHMTIAEITQANNTFLMRFRVCAVTNMMDKWSMLGEEGPYVPIEIDTKKVQIRGTQDYKKKMIIEV